MSKRARAEALVGKIIDGTEFFQEKVKVVEVGLRPAQCHNYGNRRVKSVLQDSQLTKVSKLEKMRYPLLTFGHVLAMKIVPVDANGVEAEDRSRWVPVNARVRYRVCA